MAQVTLEELLRVGREMRSWQKAFFRSKKDTPERTQALVESKYYEKAFDALIAPRAGQYEMFEEEAA